MRYSIEEVPAHLTWQSHPTSLAAAAGGPLQLPQTLAVVGRARKPLRVVCVEPNSLLQVDTESSFDIGYIQGSHLITIKSVEDLLEVWANIKKGTNVILWCDGLKKSTHGSKK